MVLYVSGDYKVSTITRHFA